MRRAGLFACVGVVPIASCWSGLLLRPGITSHLSTGYCPAVHGVCTPESSAHGWCRAAGPLPNIDMRQCYVDKAADVPATEQDYLSELPSRCSAAV